MAHTGIENGWRKFSLGADSAGSSAAPSRSHSYLGNIIYCATQESGLEPGGLEIQTRPNNQRLSSIDLGASWEGGDDGQDSFLSATDQDTHATNGRGRNKSISFHPEARLDNGDKHNLDEPLPRTASLRNVSDTDRPNGRKFVPVPPTQFDPAICKTNPFTGEPVRRRPRRQDTASSGLSIMDAFNRGNNTYPSTEPNMASLTSASTESPPRDEPLTPLSLEGSYLGSISAVSSPTMESEPWPAYRSGSLRSGRTMNTARPLSLRRESRRSSRRSGGSSSFSPASAFLSQWGRDSMQAAVPDPDDEGQSFGIENEYIIGRQIGYGGFSVVKEAFSISSTGEKRKQAVKIVRKSIREKAESENDKCQQELEREVGIWKFLDHEHILGLHAVFDTDFATFCVMDLNEGGSLYDLVRDRRKANASALPSDTVKSYARQLASALRYLHEDVRVVHRDVKMENCLIEQDRTQLGDKPGRLRLCDFGLADFITSDAVEASINGSSEDAKGPGQATNVMGSLEYAAPEIMRTPAVILSPTVDVWAYGVCVYTLITRDRPFKHSMATKLVELITNAVWDERTVVESTSSQGSVDDILALLRGCLDPDATTRWTINDVLQSKWFEGLDES